MANHLPSRFQCLWEREGAAIPDDAAIKQGEDEIESNGAPGDKMVHPRPEVGL